MASSSEHRTRDDSDLDLSRRVIEPDLLRERRVSQGDADGDVGAQFDLNWRGYDRHQVDAYLRTWGEDYWVTKNERDALLAELDHLRAAPPVQLTPLTSMSARLQDIVAAAEEEAAALRHESREAADAILAEARAEADADRTAAAAERSVAIAEADRVTREARAQYEQVVGEAHELFARTTAEASAEAARTLEDARAEAAEIREDVAAEQDRLLSAARAEAEELARTTARQRDMAEAEHQRLLSAHASQQRHFSEGLRREIAQLQAEVERLTTEVERRRTHVIASAPTAPAMPPPTSAGFSGRSVSSTLLSTEEVAAAARDESSALGHDTGEVAPLDSFLHVSDTDEVDVGAETSIFERTVTSARSAIDALRREPATDDAYADDALDLVAGDRDAPSA